MSDKEISPGDLLEQAFSDEPDNPEPKDAAPEGEVETEVEPETETEGGEQPESDDPLAGVPDDVRSLLEEHQSKLRQAEERLAQREREYHALHNRLAPTQQKLAEYERLLKKDTQAPGDGKAADALDSVLNSPKFKRYAESYPEDAEAIQEALSLVWQSADQRYRNLEKLLKEKVEPAIENMTRSQARHEFERGVQRLTEKHPDWQDIQNQAEFDAWFNTYRASQPAIIRDKFYNPEELKVMLSDADFVISLLDSYKRDLYLANQETIPSQKPRQPSRAHAAPKVNGETAIRRVSTENMSPGELFEHLWNQ